MNIQQSFKYQLLHNRDGQSSSCQWADLRLRNRTKENLTRAVKELCCLAALKAATGAIGSDRKATALVVFYQSRWVWREPVGAGGSFHLKETNKNTTQVFISCKLLLQCTADWLWQEFCSTLQCIAAWSPARVVTDGRPFAYAAWLAVKNLMGFSKRFVQSPSSCFERSAPPPFSSVLRVLLLAWGIIFNPREKHSALVSKLIENDHLSSSLSSEHFIDERPLIFFFFLIWGPSFFSSPR